MKSLRTSAITACVMLAALAVASFAQGPLHKKVNYTISAPFALQRGDRVLPAGNYVLYQFNLDNPNLFALYPEDMTHTPVAVIHTTRIDFSSRRYPEKTQILFNQDEEQMRRGVIPTVKGWTIPGTDGWEIISVVTDRNRILAEMR